jgi:hypothetical protein
VEPDFFYWQRFIDFQMNGKYKNWVIKKASCVNELNMVDRMMDVHEVEMDHEI